MKIQKYLITCRDDDGEIIRRQVEGIEVFEIKGFKFFLHHDFPGYIVSDVEGGIKVSWGNDAVIVISQAYELISNNIDKYTQEVRNIKEQLFSAQTN